MVSATTMSGSSASSGGKSAMRSTAVSTSLRTFTLSTRSLSSTVTTPRFSDAVESTRSTPSMPRVASSTRRVMPSSTSVGVAPGYGTVMLMTPGSMVGKICAVKPMADSVPPMSITAITKFAATMLCENAATRPRRCGRGATAPPDCIASLTNRRCLAAASGPGPRHDPRCRTPARRDLPVPPARRPPPPLGPARRPPPASLRRNGPGC